MNQAEIVGEEKVIGILWHRMRHEARLMMPYTFFFGKKESVISWSSSAT